MRRIALFLPVALLVLLRSAWLLAAEPTVATFSIVARDPATGEMGIAVASRFFSVGSVVPWARAGAGAVATQAAANTAFGPRGLDLLQSGLTADEALKVLLRNDPGASGRQLGIVATDGSSATYSGPDCNAWAGGRNGPNYAIQGNILAGQDVVIAMEKSFLESKGTLARRMYTALLAGDAHGGDSRGKESAALVVVKEGAGYAGYSDRAIDIRVDDHADPFGELGRLLDIAEMNYAWNEGWTAFTKKRFPEALEAQERAIAMAPANPEVLYDLAVIRLAAGHPETSLDALEKALAINPKLRKQAREDHDLDALHPNARYQKLTADQK